MTVKLTGTFSKEMLAYNGLEQHRDIIVETEMGGEEWEGYAVCRLSVKQVARIGGTGEMVPTVQVVHIEVMEGARVEPARRALLDTFKERATDGVVDPVESDDSDFLRHATGLHVGDPDFDDDECRSESAILAARDRRVNGPDFDPYANPDESSEIHNRRPVERVELPESEDVTP